MGDAQVAHGLDQALAGLAGRGQVGVVADDGQFLAAVEEATIYLTNHPDDAWALFVKAYPDLDDDLNRRAWADTLPRFAKRPAALDAGRYQRFAEFMHAAGLIKTVPAVDSYAVEIK